MDPSAAIEVEDLVKRYARRPSNAVDGVSFQVRPGEVFGLLGPNGAGKTTTVAVLTTRALPTSGTARAAGLDVVADPVGVRRRIGVVTQNNTLDRQVTVRQNLLYHASYHDVPASQRRRRADEMLEMFDLTEHANQMVDRISGGQAQRLLIARALMHDPQVLFLDEPSTGLDPQVRLFVWEQVRKLRDTGVAVLLTTHYMEEAAQLSDRVAIMDRGKLLALDTPDALTRSLPGHSTLKVSAEVADGAAGGGDGASLLSALAEMPAVERIEEVAGATSSVDGQRVLRARLYLNQDAPGQVQPVATIAERFGARLTDVAIGQPSLEDVFIKMTGRGLR
ncbi:MAG TPA: ATP-binding cassette domain-containing protein [Micromonosporaceae bacterium]|nr:ATP-binding cassette domain-containing protein [Micromonosporaceae bacterium]